MARTVAHGNRSGSAPSGNAGYYQTRNGKGGAVRDVEREYGQRQTQRKSRARGAPGRHTDAAGQHQHDYPRQSIASL
ncbi:hypothetical protein [Pseudocitrobacter faecalis]|uniref:hypothetical protein n=1 Tax=Pseudocitrobacter faecalis TaxID=1398493 RepID=UPI0040634170